MVRGVEPTDTGIQVDPDARGWNLVLGVNVEVRRKELGLSYEKLSRRADISLDTVRAVAKGVGNPQLSTVEAIAQALGVSPWELADPDLPFILAGDLETDRRPIAKDADTRVSSKGLPQLFHWNARRHPAPTHWPRRRTTSPRRVLTPQRA
jgi:transcriptional regulator with XRE-family HTH domain